MRIATKSLVALTLLTATTVLAQQPPQIGAAPVVLSSTPYVFDTAEQHRIKVTVLAKGLARPFAIEFVPGGDLLVSERGGGLRVIHDATSPNPTLDPQPIEGMPKPPADSSFSVGFQDMALAPDFAKSHWLYFTYNEPAPRPADADKTTPALYTFGKFTVMRGKLENGRITGIEKLLQGGVSAALGSRLAFAKDGSLFVTTGGAFGKTSQDLSTIYGKVLHLNAVGTIPPDNPFVGKAGANPAVYSYGHRDQHGLTVHPVTGDLLNAEHGPNGGDEVNLIKPGRNYGWPDYSYGRNYDGAPLSDTPVGPGIERPLLVWLPSIGPSGLLIYEGDKFPAWKGNLFVGSARWGEVPGTGSLQRVVMNDTYGEIRREALLTELHQRVRDVAQGPDGFIYVLTDGPENAVLRIEPAAP
ncbi:MAG TPA: PQQ-dependent sugar dehydrogenase [Croceibacterium sp.]|nr:PQQ-dependent sugar dehydrogenase [Croceibacterium sp.]